MDIEFQQPPPLPDRDPRQDCRYPPPPPPPPSARQTFFHSCLAAGCATILAPVLIVFGFFAVIFFLASSSLSESGGSLESIYSRSGRAANLREKVLRDGRADATVLVVTIHGGIDGNGSPLEGDGMLAFVSDQLRAAGEDDAVVAVLLQIDSPGGGLGASDQIYNEVRILRSKGKRVVAWGGDMMASGGYYIAAAAEGIMASPTATVGSIGVVMRHFQVSGLMEKLGIRADPVVSGARKDIGSPFRDMTPEERKLLQDYIDAAHRRFVGVVAEGRGMDKARVAELADGRIFTADDCLANGLVDRVGYIDDALAWVEELVGETDLRVVTYRRFLALSDIFREAGHGAAKAVVEASETAPSPRAMAIME